MKNSGMRKVFIATVLLLALCLRLLVACSEKKCTVTFDVFDFDITVLDMTVEQGSTIFIPTPEMPSGYVFLGWFTDRALSNRFDGVVNSDITLYLGYAESESSSVTDILNLSIVTYDATKYSLGSKRVAQSRNQATKKVNLSSFERIGYTLIWYADSELTEPYDFESSVTTDITIYAGYDAIKYTVRIDTLGGVLSTGEVNEEYVVAQETETEFDISDRVYLPAPIKTAYAFVSYYENAEYTGSAQLEYVNFNTLSQLGNLVLYPKYTPIKYTLILNTYKYGATLVDEALDNRIEYTVESDAIDLPDAKCDGFVFVGWECRDLTGEVTIINVLPQGSYGILELRAVFEEEI